MTNHWIDIKNARTIMVLGANPCENHPVVWQYINDARAAGAKLIVADPRRTRTAAQADVFMRMRPGTNGAFIMGLINYLITNNLYDSIYQTATISRIFTDASGNPVSRIVPKWTDALFRLNAGRTDYQRDGNGYPVVSTLPLNDLTSNTDTVFQVLKARAAHYTSSVVADVCDIPGGAAAFEQFAAMVGASHGAATITGNENGDNSGKGANFPGTILYAMGGTQSSHAAQDLRAYSMLQMLLGNMGRAGGGVNALRGIHNVQGSTDMGLLYGDVPGYSSVPPASGSGSNYGDYMDKLYGGPRVLDSLGSGTYWNETDSVTPNKLAANGWNLQQHGFRNMMHHYFMQGTTPFAADIDLSAVKAADWVVSQSAQWNPGNGGPDSNVVGIIALGLLETYNITKKAAYKTEVDAAATFLKARTPGVLHSGSNWRGSDILFLRRYAVVCADAASETAAQAEWAWAKANDPAAQTVDGWKAQYDVADKSNTLWQNGCWIKLAKTMGDTTFANALAAEMIAGGTLTTCLAQTAPDPTGNTAVRYGSVGNFLYALTALDPTRATYAAQMTSCATYLHNTQDNTAGNGWYEESPWQIADPVQSTEYAIWGLTAEGSQKTDVTEALIWLASQQQTDGSYSTTADKTNYGINWCCEFAAEGMLAFINARGIYMNNLNFDLMPKGSGLNHLDMFRKAADAYAGADKVKCMFVFGQNPAVTEPNLPMVKTGLAGLDTLVVTDIFESETAGCDRKTTGVTYLLPSSSFVEEEGSTTNSGRWLQWRYKAINPQGNSKSDTEILLRLAKALFDNPTASGGSAFSHIPGATYAALYGTPYGWTPGTDFNAGTTAATVAENIFIQMAHKNQNAAPYGALWIYRGGYGGWNHGFTTAHGDTKLTAGTSIGATSISVVANNSTVVGDTLWIGVGTTLEQCTVSAINGLDFTLVKALTKAHSSGDTVAHVQNRAKSRGALDVGDQGTGTTSDKSIYGNWGWAWLKNRRVFYNNGGVAQDVSDNFVAPDYVGRYYVHAGDTTGMPTPVPYASTYRAYSTLADLNKGDNSTCVAVDPARMPKHWEPHETPNEAARTKYGITGDAPSTAAGAVANYPLVLTTIRVTEHFQGGPTTRNIPWLCELVNEPFIELNSADAYAYGIKDGDPVLIDTVRASNVGPFKAVVGSGIASTQHVKKGMVAIPWHWGNKGISQGASANEVTIDAVDTNIKMPEYKACLCRIHK